MKTATYSLLVLGLAAGMSAAGGPKQKAETLKTFGTANPTISKDVAVTEEKAWLADCKKEQTIRLFEVENPGVEQCMVIYRAKLKTENLKDQAYLEMWCRFSGKGEFFSRGLEHAVTGSNDWASYETPFFLKKGEKPDLIKLNLVVKGSGKVWVKDVELLKSPPPPLQGSLPPGR
jgi:hypothetical protein